MMFVPLLMLVLILDGVCSSEDPYTYVGCHKDDDKRDIPYNPLNGTTSNPMTADRCSDRCEGYLIFGVQNGDECWCGQIYGRYQDRDDSECSNCEAQPDKMCGGSWYNSVYKRNYQNSETLFGLYDDEYMGCFEDRDSERDLSHHHARSNYMTLTYCNQVCQRFKYFGVKNGDECWCGDNDERRYGWENDCNLTCTGDSTTKCGGSGRIAVFRTQLPTETIFFD